MKLEFEKNEPLKLINFLSCIFTKTNFTEVRELLNDFDISLNAKLSKTMNINGVSETLTAEINILDSSITSP